MIRNKNIEQRVGWARKNLDNTFEDIVWMDESLIQLENHGTFSYPKVGAAPKAQSASKISL